MESPWFGPATADVISVPIQATSPNRRQSQCLVIVLAADPAIRDGLLPEFAAAGYQVAGFASWPEALEFLKQRRPEALVAEASLADGPVKARGLQLDHTLPEAHPPLLVLASSPDPATRERWLEAGADDVVIRPFNPREVLLRIRSLLRQRRPEPAPASVVHVDPICLDAEACRVSVRGREVRLTVREFRLLMELARHPGQVLSREQLLQQLWPPDPTVSVRAVDTQVRRIRRKLGEARRYLRTIRGFGYCLTATLPTSSARQDDCQSR